ncbi:hypothetical protein SAMN04488528_104016 [Clostridium frigidicarnis]|uniref:Uncharacterized protein n=1 Tax=Clostridium frigidicarnis TaxID=84698 RepID=A0A1I1ARI1_9CLOT|nr:hypothetical protein SAMN04488528_104016 [Clostridium frigidicarnis]
MSYKYDEIIKLLRAVIEILNMYDTDLSYTRFKLINC